MTTCARGSAALQCTLLAAFLLRATSTYAQPASDQDDAVRAQFEEAKVLFADNRIAEACTKLGLAREKRPEWVGVTLWLGTCYERSGDLLGAWEMYESAERTASTTGRAEDAASARARAAAIEKQLPGLRLRVPDEMMALTDLMIRQDGDMIDRGRWPRRIPIAPSKHHITVSASGRMSWQTDVDATGSTAELTIDVPSLPMAPPVSTAASSVSALASDPTTGKPRPSAAPVSTAVTRDRGPSRDDASWVRTIPAWAWLTAGSGLVLGATGLGFLSDELSVQATIDQHCSSHGCDTLEGFHVKDANAHLFRSYGFFVGLGVAGLAALGTAIGGVALTSWHPVRTPGSPAPPRSVVLEVPRNDALIRVRF